MKAKKRKRDISRTGLNTLELNKGQADTANREAALLKRAASFNIGEDIRKRNFGKQDARDP